jgi:hypothetical protein
MNQSESQPRLKALLVIIFQGNENINLVPRLFPLRSWLEKIPWLGLVT